MTGRCVVCETTVSDSPNSRPGPYGGSIVDGQWFHDDCRRARPIFTAAELAAHKVDAHGRDYSKSDDGYSDMEVAAEDGWVPIAGWGRDGWDLGDWPYVVVSKRQVTPVNGPFGSAFQMRQTVEGDTTVYHFDSIEDRDAAIDYLFVRYGIGREYDEWTAWGVTSRKALDAGTLRVPEELRGAYSPSRATV